MVLALTHEYCILISRLKTQVKKHGIEIESGKMSDPEYASRIIDQSESLSDIEILASCERVKEIIKENSGT